MALPLFACAGRSCYTITCGLILLTAGITLTFSKSWLLKLILPAFVLQPNSVIEDFWRKPPIKIVSNMYLFNWTNPEDLFNMSTKPKFQQVGPYRFLQEMEKVNVTFNDNNTVTYNQMRTWKFDEEPSNGNLSDVINTVNFLTLCIAHKVRYWSYFSTATISSLMSVGSPNVHVTKTANEILLESHDNLVKNMLTEFSFLVPEAPNFKDFGLLNFRNGTYDFEGVINMANGVNGSFDILNWNYMNETPSFEGKCSNVRGSMGELYSPRHDKSDIEIFYADICRTLVFEYEKKVVVDGILGYKYFLGNKTFDNGTLIPENKCYCTGECTPFGVLNVSSCQNGLPLYASLPNFYGANLNDMNVEGLQPEKNKHETYVIIEPATGIPLKAVVRVQFNSLLHPIESISIYEKVPKVYFPLVWAEMEIRLPDQFTPLLRMYLDVPFIYNIITNVLIALGACTLSVALVLRIKSIFSENNNLQKRKQSISLHSEEVRPLKKSTRTF